MKVPKVNPLARAMQGPAMPAKAAPKAGQHPHANLGKYLHPKKGK